MKALLVQPVAKAMRNLDVKLFLPSSFYILLAGETCVNCSQNAGYYIRFIVYLVIQILIIALVTKYLLYYFHHSSL